MPETLQHWFLMDARRRLLAERSKRAIHDLEERQEFLRTTRLPFCQIQKRPLVITGEHRLEAAALTAHRDAHRVYNAKPQVEHHRIARLSRLIFALDSESAEIAGDSPEGARAWARAHRLDETQNDQAFPDILEELAKLAEPPPPAPAMAGVSGHDEHPKAIPASDPWANAADCVPNRPTDNPGLRALPVRIRFPPPAHDPPAWRHPRPSPGLRPASSLRPPLRAPRRAQCQRSSMSSAAPAFLLGAPHAALRCGIGPWSDKTFNHKNYPNESAAQLKRRHTIVVEFIDAVNALLAALAAKYPRQVHHGNLPGTLKSPADWANELQPKNKGFVALAAKINAARLANL